MSLLSRIRSIETRLEFMPGRIIGQSAYGTALMLAWLVEEKGIEPACAGVGQNRA